MKKRVLVAMSGGVDSSVAAYLLKEQGYDVVGVTFQLYDYSRANRKEGKGGCCSIEDVTDARLVCRKLGIQHFLFDSKDRFMDRVVKYFSESYKQGLTPNPCVACNTFIKFDELEHYANVVEADLFATGHYAKIIYKDGEPYLQKAKDPLKDQSYFLMGVKPAYLKRMIFPLAELDKEQVRRIADEMGLPTSQKPESMEICFVPENNYRKFLEQDASIVDSPGDVVDEKGNIIARHRGIHHFTVGQKKGLGEYGLHHHYVIRLDPETKQVTVGLDKSLYSTGLRFSVVQFRNIESWIGKPLQVKIRSRAEAVNCTITSVDSQAVTILFDEPQRAISPGQFAVFYDQELLVGGGPILRAVAHFDHDVGRTSESLESRVS